jgi:hypothetical protein
LWTITNNCKGVLLFLLLLACRPVEPTAPSNRTCKDCQHN